MTSIYPSSTSSSTNSSTSSSNLLRISGMASGIDTDSVVKSMVSSYQTKIDKANQAKQTLQWKQDAYRDIIKGIKGLQEYFDPLSSKYMLTGNSLNINTAASDDASIVSAKAGSTAKPGTYNVTVSKLASQAKIEGSSENSMVKVTVDGSEWNGATLNLNGTSISLGSITDTSGNGTILDEVVTKINNDPNLNTKILASTDATGSYINFKNISGDGSSIILSAKDSGGSELFSNNNIADGSSQNYKEDLSKLSGKTLDFGSAHITLSNIPAGTGVNATSMSNLAADINNQLSSTSLNGKISASYVSDGTNSYIKFVNSDSSTPITLKKNGSGLTNVSDITSDVSVNSGISSSSLLTTLGFTGTDTTPGTINFTIANGTTPLPVSLKVNSSTTVQNLMDQVNSATSGAVTMSIDDTTGKISFQSKSYGSASNISIIDTSTDGNSISHLGMSTVSASAGTMKSADSSSISSSSLLTNLGFTGSDTSPGNIDFTLTNGGVPSHVSLQVNSSTTVQNLLDAVNNATNGQVTTNVNYKTGQILFHSNTNSNITITNNDVTNNVNSILNLTAASSTATNTGADAMVAIKGPGESTATTTTQSSNQFTVNGVSYNLVGVNNATNPDSNVTVTANSDTVVTNIKNFINDYNTLISTINTKLTEKQDSAYPPLTDAQKSSMSESQITAWEAKAKVGILRNDDYLQNLMTQLRGVFSPVYSSYTDSSTNTGISLNFGKYGSGAIGIDTSKDYTDGGKLVITDESKLRNAIENNFDDFKKLFIGSSDQKLATNQTYIGSSKYYEDGMFTRMSNIISDYVATPGIGTDGTYTLSGSMNIFVNKQYDYSSMGSSGKNTLPDQVYAQTLSISKLKTQMSDAETRYYNQFTALETAMNALNSQQSQLSSMLGNG